jgi:hypothetical protein
MQVCHGKADSVGSGPGLADCAGFQLPNGPSLGNNRKKCPTRALPVTWVKDYSYLKATIGSTRIARQAGT